MRFNAHASQDFLRNICLISDGNSNNKEDVSAITEKLNRHTRIFTFGVGDNCAHHFLRSLARLGGGVCELFDSSRKSKWQAKVVKQMERTAQPGLMNISIDWVQVSERLRVGVCWLVCWFAWVFCQIVARSKSLRNFFFCR